MPDSKKPETKEKLKKSVMDFDKQNDVMFLYLKEFIKREARRTISAILQEKEENESKNYKKDSLPQSEI
jgi:hypothetical protein